ncbi:MAG: Dolichyl-phosphate-mannose-mannosyltransferase family protein [Anaerolineaceae bacterium]|nr:MAG: Dolichyl-phosphate-mannose-mannosyltransferase family protein [Anaerolineaceae bacterium]
MTIPSEHPASFLDRKIAGRITTTHLLLAGIILLSVFLHFANIGSIGDSNAYYTAAVESMTQSWHNFFFAAAEPGGSVTVDKPPLGLWIETLFALGLGVSGFSTSLPNILAGILSVPLLYHLVQKHLGKLAGLVAALVLTVTPVLIATDRNNTMDGMLVFVLLLAAWAFIAAVESGKLRYLLLGAFIVGLGFNIKMMQAFLPLPAFYALYFFASKNGWWRKLLHLALATVVLVIVSLSWAVAVDLTPADERPYIGSSQNNTVMELIIGHNGMSRLLGGKWNAIRNQADAQGPDNQSTAPGIQPPAAPLPSGQPSAPGSSPAQPAPQGPPQQAFDACAGQTLGAACSFDLPYQTITGICIMPPNFDRMVCTPPDKIPQQSQPQSQPQTPGGSSSSTPFSQETGSPGVFRFFQPPLSKQMSWLLPFALLGILLLAFAGRIRFPLEAGGHKALVLWGGWLLTCLVFFSAIEGIFHAYYAIMLAPALGAVVGGGFALLWRWQAGRPWVNGLLLAGAAATVGFEIYAAHQYGVQGIWMFAAGALLLAGILLLLFRRTHSAGYASILTAMLVIPFFWTVMTTLGNPDLNLPTAYAGTGAPQANIQQPANAPASQPRQNANRGRQVNEALLAFLQENTQGVEYLVAVPSAGTGAPMVIATGRPVLYMGGFGGSDPVIDAQGLAEMVADGELRYVLYGSEGRGNGILVWLKQNCIVVPGFGPSARNAPNADNLQLYRCDG